jgi:hypothetical protein
MGVQDGWQVAQDLRQLRLAELAGSTGAVAQAGQPRQGICHARHLLSLSAISYRVTADV